MDAISFLRSQINDVHEMLEGTMQDVTPEQAHWQPAGKATPLGAQYTHIILGEDLFLNMLVGRQPLGMSAYAGKMGVSEPPPMDGAWDEWARRVKLDLPALRQYAQAVYKNTLDYVSSLKPDDLEREIDMSNFGLGKQTLAWVMNSVVSHVAGHCGEISCLKGLQGAKGYPF